MSNMNIVESFVEVRLKDAQDFLKVRETLTRMGVASKHEKVLYQSCHILHKKKRVVSGGVETIQSAYYIVHFKEMFRLDGKPTQLTDDDIARRNAIAKILDEWGLVTIVDPKKVEAPVAPISQIKIIPHKEKVDWQLVPKYNMGNSKKLH